MHLQTGNPATHPDERQHGEAPSRVEWQVLVLDRRWRCRCRRRTWIAPPPAAVTTVGGIPACVLLLYNPATKCPLHVHAYRCDSETTAEALHLQLQILINRPDNQKRFEELETRWALVSTTFEGVLILERRKSLSLIFISYFIPALQANIIFANFHFFYKGSIIVFCEKESKNIVSIF